MKRIIVLMVLGLGFQTATGQIKYTDEGFSTPKAEKTFGLKTAGEQFIDRMDALYGQSNPEYQLQSEYNQYIREFQQLASQTPYKKERLQILGQVLKTTNDQMYNQAGFRLKMLAFVDPLFIAMKQNWGKEVIEMALAEAYLSIYEFLQIQAVDYPTLQSSMNMLKENEMVDRSEGHCTYSVVLDKKIARDQIDIYFSDFGSYRRLAKNFSDGKLLRGPVPYWEDEKASSQTVREMMDAYIQQTESPVKYVMKVNTEKGKERYSTELPKGMKWFVWVFRNGNLYYHYMIEPCGFENTLEVLDIQIKPLEAIGDPDAYSFE